MQSRSVWIAVFVGIIALGLIAAVVTAFVTDNGEPSGSSRTPVVTSSVSDTFDLPSGLDSDALALGRHQGDVLVGLAARPGGPVEIAVVRGDTPLSGDAARVTVDGRTVSTESCGTGCSRVQADVFEGRPTSITVSAGSTPVSFKLPASLPASGQAAFDRARSTMAALRSYRFTERLTSGGPTVFTHLAVQAPDRLSLRTTSGFRSVIIGHKRWDYVDGRWQKAPFPGLNVREVLMWYDAKNPRVLRRLPNGDVQLAAYGLKPVPAWFRLTVEPSGRVSEAEMTAPAHFMLHKYSDFNTASGIEPPK
jgi:hypothetical protein